MGRWRLMILVLVDRFKYRILSLLDEKWVFWMLKMFMSVSIISLGMYVLIFVSDCLVILIYWRVRFFILGIILRLFVLRYMLCNFRDINCLFVVIYDLKE